MQNIPNELKKVINMRDDLRNLGYLRVANERKLVVWVILHGFIEYPIFREGGKDNNQILKWLSSGSTIKSFNNIPRIVLGIWDIFQSHQRRWPYPHLNFFYQYWLKENWGKLGINLPTYNSLFPNAINRVGFLQYIVYNLIWKIRKPISLKVKAYLGFDLDFYLANKLNGWQIQINVIRALVYRELKTRVSQVKFGVVGVFIQPLGTLSIFLILFSIIRGNRGSLDIVLFLGTGIVLFTVFNDITIRSSNGIAANEALFFYRPVKPIDTVIARTLVESGLYAIVFIVIILFVYLIRQEIIMSDISLMFFSYIALVIYCLGLGLFLLVATFIYPVVVQIIPLLMRPLFFVSGVFISLQNLPRYLWNYVTWNPVFQAIELTRHSFSESYILEESRISLTYLWASAIFTLFLGLWVYSINEKRLLTR